MSEVRNMMLEDSKDLLDNVEVSTVAQECVKLKNKEDEICLLYTSPSPRDGLLSRMPSSA